MVNIFTDPKARKTPCSISLPNEMWNQIDELIRIRFGNRINRSTFTEELYRHELEAAKNDIPVQPGETISTSAVKSLINRIKDFVHDNAQSKNVGGLEAIRRPLDELNFFNNEEIRRSRTPTKSDKRHAALVSALKANKARMESNGSLVIDSSLIEQPALDPSPNRPKHVPPMEGEQSDEPGLEKGLDSDPLDYDYESLLGEFSSDWKEEPIPKPDFEIVDEGRTEKNPYDKTGTEEIFR